MELLIHREGAKEPERFELPAGAEVTLAFTRSGEFRPSPMRLNDPEAPVAKVEILGERHVEPTPEKPLPTKKYEVTAAGFFGAPHVPGSDKVEGVLKVRR